MLKHFQNTKSVLLDLTTRARQQYCTSSWWTRWSTRPPPSGATWRRSSGTTSTSSCGTSGARSLWGRPGTPTTPTRSSFSLWWTARTGRDSPSQRRNYMLYLAKWWYLRVLLLTLTGHICFYSIPHSSCATARKDFITLQAFLLMDHIYSPVQWV